jgi:hypothetical protein
MGMDVLLYAKADPSAETLAVADAFIRRHCPIADTDDWRGGRAKALTAERTMFDDPRVELNTLSRYFDPYYPRGHWPSIYQAIMLMQACFPNSAIFYGSDAGDDGYEVTDELLAENWAAWAYVDA